VYYIITHAYFHYIGIVDEVVGPKTVWFRNHIAIHSSTRSWTDFFRDGIKKGDRYDIMPDGGMLTAFNAWPWAHDIPTEKMQ
jgi:hypothetical protein